MDPEPDDTSRFSIIGFIIRLVASIVVPVALIGTVLWWFVARDQVDKAVERRAVIVAELVGTVVEPHVSVDQQSKPSLVDTAALDAAITDIVEPAVGSDVEFRLLALDGTVLFSTDPAELGKSLSLDLVDSSVLRGVASGRVFASRDELTPVGYSVPISASGRTVAAARLDVADDALIADAQDSSGRLVYLFGGALLAIVIALVPLCWWSLGEVRRQFRRTRTLAMNDNLTGLANRTQFHERLDEAIAGASRSDSRVGLVVLDLDGFKAINDTGGHAAGDRLLRRVAAALGEATRRHETACRLGGDEFAVVAPRIADREELRRLADRLHEQLDLDVAFSDGRTLRVTASLGLALFPDDAATTDELVNSADASMYSVKASRKAKLPKAARDRASAGR